VTSIRKLAANRANARKSRGPKTALGRARSSRNALRHGLAAARPDGAAAPEVEALARSIAGPGANDEIVECARRVALAQVDLARVESARRVILAEVLCPPGPAEAAADTTEAAAANRLVRRMRNLRGLDRYERSALARRRFAIHAPDEERRRQATAPAGQTRSE